MGGGSGSGMVAFPIIGDIWDAVSGVFSSITGWALDAVISLITSWIIAGVLALIEAFWSVIDASTHPLIDQAWFSGDTNSPYVLALGIGATVLTITLLFAVIRGVLSGSPSAITKAVGRDLPSAVFAMLATIGFTKVGLDLADQMSSWIWETGTRENAKAAFENLSRVMMTGLPGTQFLGIAVALGLLFAMLFLWVVLFVRESLIYLVIVFSAAFAWPAIVFPPLRDTAKKSLELLVALIVAKPVIMLALSVGVAALGRLGTPVWSPGAGIVDNAAQELGTLVVGVVTFGIAAFMPMLVWKLMPLVTAAVVAQGVAGAPMRTAQQGMQLQYYGASMMNRLSSGGRVPGGGSARSSTGGSLGASAAAGAGRGGAAGRAGAAGSAGRAGAGGLAGVAAVPVTVGKVASSTVNSVTPPHPPPASPPLRAGPSGSSSPAPGGSGVAGG